MVPPEIITLRMVSTMTREILNKPHPTPNPDGPHAAGSIRGTTGGSGEALRPTDDFPVGEPNYDSCVDDLNLILSQPVTEPDPALRSKASSDVLAPTTGSSSADDHFADGRLYWALIGLMSYSSAVTLALTWVLWTGRGFRPAEHRSPAADRPAGESPPKMVDLEAGRRVATASRGKRGKTGRNRADRRPGSHPYRVIVTRSSWLDRSNRTIGDARMRESFVLRLRLTNVSQDQSFAPLERRLCESRTRPWIGRRS